jgi:hypothetical protein
VKGVAGVKGLELLPRVSESVTDIGNNDEAHTSKGSYRELAQSESFVQPRPMVKLKADHGGVHKLDLKGMAGWLVPRDTVTTTDVPAKSYRDYRTRQSWRGSCSFKSGRNQIQREESSPEWSVVGTTRPSGAET